MIEGSVLSNSWSSSSLKPAYHVPIDAARRDRASLLLQLWKTILAQIVKPHLEGSLHRRERVPLGDQHNAHRVRISADPLRRPPEPFLHLRQCLFQELSVHRPLSYPLPR